MNTIVWILIIALSLITLIAIGFLFYKQYFSEPHHVIDNIMHGGEVHHSSRVHEGSSVNDEDSRSRTLVTGVLSKMSKAKRHGRKAARKLNEAQVHLNETQAHLNQAQAHAATA